MEYKPIEQLEFRAAGDVGFFVGDERTYQILLESSYFFKKWFVTSLGYRFWSAKIPKDKTVYSGTIKGVYVRIGFEF